MTKGKPAGARATTSTCQTGLSSPNGIVAPRPKGDKTAISLVAHKQDLAREPASPDLLVLLEAVGYDSTIGYPPSQLWALQALGYLISQRGAA